MDKYSRRVSERLHECGAELVSTRRHRKWRLPDGQVFIQPTTPSDWRSSRKQDSTLKRLMANSEEVEANIPAAHTSGTDDLTQRARFRSANYPEHRSGEVKLPKLNPSETQAANEDWRFGRIVDVLTAVDEVPEYWALDCCGRVRVLMKMASRFTKRIEVITAFGVIDPADGVNLLEGATPWVTDHSPEAKMRREVNQIGRYLKQWGRTAKPSQRWITGMRGLPCLRLLDPKYGEVVIETSLSGLLLGVEKTEVFGGLQFAGGSMRASLPQWKDYEGAVAAAPDALPHPYPDEGYLTFLFIDQLGMKENKVTYATCANWSAPSVSRRVIQRVFEWCNKSENCIFSDDSTPL